MKFFTIIFTALAVGAMAAPAIEADAAANAARGISERDALQKRACGQCAGGSRVCWTCGVGGCSYYQNSC
ncbi:hypothetical protein HYQ45_001342 [Verticillium longisporum]|uniref:Uncharacterized protein n=2 Tax=Verticillium TaxID=1036719 RepID=A0A8I3AWW0_VERLO|nr:hypothetical protein VdG1_06416 [Verticillium dahliae VDG1]KAG7142270.1 hypothetical protein HYQ45_001342 [Verticillium longisporum]PNH31187.1 hypothetical protein BJF96_g5539 [Verticillium dahliae]PNH47374.1 hypothetical protein VD0004_g903 [Verticillium dahliae]PNH57674.1 hypothetical protein VD0003_g133 [Verticillium dahliae]